MIKVIYFTILIYKVYMFSRIIKFIYIFAVVKQTQ
jgi:hypothetical protein